MSLYFTIGRSIPLKIAHFNGDLDPIEYMVPWIHPSPLSKRHHDRFSRFTGLTTVTDRQTDRPTDDTTRSVAIGRIYVRSTAMRPNNNNVRTVWWESLTRGRHSCVFDYTKQEKGKVKY